MDKKNINDELSVSGQLTITDLQKLQEQGVKSIICNRPDNEEVGQATFSDIAKSARELGFEVKFQPVISGHLSHKDAVEFGEIVDELPKPIHAYCRSGTRCTILWALSELSQGKNRSSVLQQAANAGYDLSKSI